MAKPDAGGKMGPVRRTLVLGGARSGKSAFAQGLAESSGLAPVYVATASDFGDPEMTDRIARHRADRDARWRTVEATLDLGAALATAAPGTVLLVDCLTLWLTNVMLGDHDVEAASSAILAALEAAAGPVILVSNEVGSGIVPDNALARRFRDAQGRLNAQVARACDAVVLVAAGLPVLLKPGAMPGILVG